MRLTVCLEGNTEGRVLASVDMEEIVKMTITDDIEKSNFNPQMFKSCTDTSYQCGYEQGKADERKKVLAEFKNIWDKRVKDLINWCKDIRLIGLQQADSIFDEIVEQLKEQKK